MLSLCTCAFWHGGHYSCYDKVVNGHWYQIDNVQVSVCALIAALKQNASVLIYVHKCAWDGANWHASLGQEASDSETQERHTSMPGEPKNIPTWKAKKPAGLGTENSGTQLR